MVPDAHDADTFKGPYSLRKRALVEMLDGDDPPRDQEVSQKFEDELVEVAVVRRVEIGDLEATGGASEPPQGHPGILAHDLGSPSLEDAEVFPDDCTSLRPALHEDDTGSAPGQGLESHPPAAGTNVEEARPHHLGGEDVEEALLDPASRGTGLESAQRCELSTPGFSGQDPAH
jgi:hypothetical protein